MSKMKVLLVSKDSAWSDMLNRFIQSQMSHDLELICQKSIDSEHDWSSDQIDALLIDTASVDVKSDVDKSLKKQKIIYIIEENGEKSGSNTIYKYLPGDQLLNKVSHYITGRGHDQETKHYIFGSSEETGATYQAALSFCRSLTGENESCLLISLSNPNMQVAEGEQGLKDPFGRLLYYASISSERVGKELDTLVAGGPDGVYQVAKPYAFDLAQWTYEMNENLLNALRGQSTYQNLVWHIGTTYTSGFKGLLQTASSVFWLGSSHNINNDTVFETYTNLSDCRLDLKTHYECKSDWQEPGSLQGSNLERALLDFRKKIKGDRSC